MRLCAERLMRAIYALMSQLRRRAERARRWLRLRRLYAAIGFVYFCHLLLPILRVADMLRRPPLPASRYAADYAFPLTPRRQPLMPRRCHDTPPVLRSVARCAEESSGEAALQCNCLRRDAPPP